MISNINYAGKVLGCVDHLPFRCRSPQMYIKRCQDFTLLVFKSGKCRLMGCKNHISSRIINVDDLNITILRLQSATASFNVGFRLNLSKLGDFCHDNSISFLFEPELFPALRVSTFNPICINVFASGKCTILGLKHLCYQKYMWVTMLTNRSGCIDPNNNATFTKVVVRKADTTPFQRYSSEAPGLCFPQGGGPTTNPTETVPTSTSEAPARRWS